MFFFCVVGELYKYSARKSKRKRGGRKWDSARKVRENSREWAIIERGSEGKRKRKNERERKILSQSHAITENYCHKSTWFLHGVFSRYHYHTYTHNIYYVKFWGLWEKLNISSYEFRIYVVNVWVGLWLASYYLLTRVTKFLPCFCMCSVVLYLLRPGLSVNICLRFD